MNAPLPSRFAFPHRPGATSVVLELDPDGRLPLVLWVGLTAEMDPADADSAGTPETFAADVRAVATERRSVPLLPEHSRGSYGRPGLRGHRLVAGDRDYDEATDEVSVGRDWSTLFRVTDLAVDADRLVVDAADEVAQLRLRTEIEALPGGALRFRHTVTNDGPGRYLLDGLEVAVPLPDTALEVLDFTGRHERERTPQRHRITDGQWLRENRRGRTGLESASVLVAGSAGFGFATGTCTGVQVAWSGNSVLFVDRDPSGPASIGGGEFLLPGEIALAQAESYASPWVHVSASVEGLDALAAQSHAWLRSLPAHPATQPVLLNVWEAVYFDHDPVRLRELADRAAEVGVERFVLDDGWFRGRRHDVAGLGDWWVDDAVWPGGLGQLVDHVHELGMQFGLWFEPEMVNPDSDLYRAHPDWILATGSRVPALSRNQLVLDLANPAVHAFLFERMDALLTEYPIDYVKWDHNRDLLDAGSGPSGRPSAHRQALAHYALLDELRARHPAISWESCAAGGGRIDLGVLERVQRVWTSDMTDALSRQQIQRWTTQFVAPEYLGAHVSATRSHQTGRVLPLDFRAATALFGAFGIEWNLTEATPDELARLADWVRLYKEHRALLHTGRTVRIEVPDPAVLCHGVVAADRRSALVAHVQLDESASNRGVVAHVPGLLPDATYTARWLGPIDTHPMSQAPPVRPDGPTGGIAVRGRTVADVGLWFPRRRPETILLALLEATGDRS